MKKRTLTVLPLFALAITLRAGAAAAPARQLDQIRLPAGFSIEVWAEGLTDARAMALGPNGTVFVGSRTGGKVYAAVDANADGKAETTYVLAEGLKSPHGVAFRDGDLYVAEIHRLGRLAAIADRLDEPPALELINDDDLPDERYHGWKHIAFGPDGWLYLAIGVPCNICPERTPFGTIQRMRADGSGMETFAEGIRNSVGFAWHPETRELWFTDNGRDFMGDDVPPDELNHAPKAGLDFGFPGCHGRDIVDPQHGDAGACVEQRAPVAELAPHTAALGMLFYTGDAFPAEYKGRILIAEHGSWNRREKIGYRVMQVELDGDRVKSYEPFAQGWLQGGEEWGRPVDVLQLPDGSVLVSDDLQGAIYRITHE